MSSTKRIVDPLEVIAVVLLIRQQSSISATRQILLEPSIALRIGISAAAKKAQSNWQEDERM